MKNRRYFIIGSIGLVGWLIAGYFFYINVKQEVKSNELSKAVVSNNSIINSRMPDIINQMNTTQKNVDNQREENEDKKPIDLVNSTISQMDTVQAALNKQLKDKFNQETKLIRDSLNSYKNLFAKTNQLLTLERSARKNLTVLKTDLKNIEESKNASIVLSEFTKQKRPNSIISPKRNYLRITNNLDSGLVNGLPYLDYELRNDQIYQMMFQVRSSLSPWTGRSTIGLGAELKLNNVSINAALSYGNKERWLNPSFGLRYDFARIIFK